MYIWSLHIIFANISKVLGNENSILRIYSKQNRNSQKLAVCSAHCIFSVQLSTGILGYLHCMELACDVSGFRCKCKRYKKTRWRDRKSQLFEKSSQEHLENFLSFYSTYAHSSWISNWYYLSQFLPLPSLRLLGPY